MKIHNEIVRVFSIVYFLLSFYKVNSLFAVINDMHKGKNF
jgi:hypothetical protein